MSSEKFLFKTNFLATMAILSGAAFCTNLLSSINIWRSFNVRNAIYLHLFLSSCLTTLGLGITFVISILFLMDTDSMQNLLGCSVLNSSLFLAYILAPFSLSIISVLRFCILKSSYNMQQNVKLVSVSMVIFCLGLIYLLSYITIGNYLVILPFPSLCLYGNSKVKTYYLAFSFAAIPLLLCFPISLGYDAKTYLYSRSMTFPMTSNSQKTRQQSCESIELEDIEEGEEAGPSNNRQRIASISESMDTLSTVKVEDCSHNPNSNKIAPNFSNVNAVQPVNVKDKLSMIPLNATLVSALSLIPLIPMAIVKLVIEIQPMPDNFITYTLMLLTCIFRIPLILAVTFKKNKENQRVNRDQMREEMRNLEIMYAQQERQNRRGIQRYH